MSVTGLRAIVTGGSSGIGRATVHQLRADGADVVVLDLARPDDEVSYQPADLGDDVSVRRAVDAAIGHLGGLDILINNAGIGAQGSIETNDDTEWQRVLDVNVLGLVRVTRAALPALRRSRHAAIVNTGSVVATTGVPQRALYSASKGAVLSLTLAMAADLIDDGVRVNAVNPGTADTPWVARLLDSADEVAAAIVFLASPASGSTTGTSLAVDGGMAGLRLRRG